jgi:hypothetical protein
MFCIKFGSCIQSSVYDKSLSLLNSGAHCKH